MIRLTTLFNRLIALTAIVALTPFGSLALGLDGTFSGGGKFFTTFSEPAAGDSRGTEIFVQPSGRIVIVGRYLQGSGGPSGRAGVGLVGLTTVGVLDPNFGTGGKVLEWSSTSISIMTDAAMESGGTILVLIQFSQSTPGRSVLRRYTVNGQPDATFLADLDVDGVPTIPIKLETAQDGKIYVLVRQDTNYKLVRLNTDGSRDATFAANGVRNLNLGRIPFPANITGLHPLPDGKLALIGNYSTGSFENVAFVARFDSDTNIDRTFGWQGIVRIDFRDGDVYIFNSLVQPDGKIVLAGSFVFLGSYALLIRLSTRGKYDTTFGSGGFSMSSIEDITDVYGLARRPDGKFVLTGTTSAKTFPTVIRTFVAIFGGMGSRENFNAFSFYPGLHSGGYGAGIQTDGKIIATGFTQTASGTVGQLTAARFVP